MKIGGFWEGKQCVCVCVCSQAGGMYLRMARGNQPYFQVRLSEHWQFWNLIFPLVYAHLLMSFLTQFMFNVILLIIITIVPETLIFH